MGAVAERLAEIRERVGAGVRIVAVTKGFEVDVAREAVAAGIVDLGENYAQELVRKAEAVEDEVAWHFLGHVQRNKVAPLRPHVSMWQGVDRALDLPGDVLVQVNLSGLPQRNGVAWDEAPALCAALSNVTGLMGVAGPGDPRPQFRRLAQLARGLGLAEVSMGMSGDYEVAVEEGATMVRLGTALFGPRPDQSDLRR
jgi:PLP dependent protein